MFYTYIVSKWEQTNDIRLSGGIHLERFDCSSSAVQSVAILCNVLAFINTCKCM